MAAEVEVEDVHLANRVVVMVIKKLGVRREHLEVVEEVVQVLLVIQQMEVVHLKDIQH
jgi:hypothetical protein